MNNFLGGRAQMEKQPLVKLSAVKDVKGGKYYSTQALGRHSCSMVVLNVHFVVNDLGGDLSAEDVLDWSNRYADFLRKSVQPRKDDERQNAPHENWTGANGKRILGTVKRVDQQTQSVEFITEEGEIVRNLPLNKFSESDRKKILERFSK